MSFNTEEFDNAVAAAEEEIERQRPDEPGLPPKEWVKHNLFSSVGSTILSVVFGVVALFGFRALVNFVFSEARAWDAVRVNMRLLFSQAYPEQNYNRIWLTVIIVMVLSGITLGIGRVSQGTSIKRLATNLFSVGGLIALGAVLARPAALRDEAGELLYTEANQVIRQSLGEAYASRLGWWLIAAVLIGIGLVLWFKFDDLQRRSTFVSSRALGLGFLGLLVSSTWWYKWGHYAFIDGAIHKDPDSLVASTTRYGWTVVYLALVASFFFGKWLKKSGLGDKIRTWVMLSWLLTPFVTYFVILRSPILDWGRVASVHLPLWVLFAFGGAALLYLLTKPGIGETGRLIAIAVLLVAAATWVMAFFGWVSMLQKIRLSILLLGIAGLIAPNFISEDKRQRMRFVFGWFGFITLFHILVTLVNSPSAIEVPTEDFAGGYVVTMYVAVFTLILSFPLGVILALARTSKLPIFRVMSTIYIESFRGIPLITMLFFFKVFVDQFLPEGMSLSSMAAVVIAFTLFSAAYLAENVRGGLQAIRKGQYEASDALGLTGSQRTLFIVLPQALRVSIPPLVGQTIATYKETSLLAIVGIFDFLRIARDVIPSQSQFLGRRLEGLLFISLIYFVFSFAMSRYSQQLERRLGVGSR